jgi:FlaG/FlaF family flagellin (archaellin)
MYKKSIAITAVLAASILSVVAISTPMAFADESETETEQELKQKNVGSGESTNFNCAQNLIDSAGGFVTCPEVTLGSP